MIHFPGRAIVRRPNPPVHNRSSAPMNMIDTRGEVEGTPAGITKAGVCIIGAGSSGVAAAKALMESGVEFDIFEKGSAVGGMWRYQNDNGLSSAYASLHIDTSRLNAGYPDFPL